MASKAESIVALLHRVGYPDSSFEAREREQRNRKTSSSSPSSSLQVEAGDVEWMFDIPQAAPFLQVDIVLNHHILKLKLKYVVLILLKREGGQWGEKRARKRDTVTLRCWK